MSQAKLIQHHDDIVDVGLIGQSKSGWLVNLLPIIMIVFVCVCVSGFLPVHVVLVDAVGTTYEPPAPAGTPNVIFTFINIVDSETNITLTSPDHEDDDDEGSWEGKPQRARIAIDTAESHSNSNSNSNSNSSFSLSVRPNSNSGSNSGSASLTFSMFLTATVPSNGFTQVEIPPSLIRPYCENGDPYSIWAYIHLTSFPWKPFNNVTLQNTKPLYCLYVYGNERVTDLVQSVDDVFAYLMSADIRIKGLLSDFFRPVVNTNQYPHHGFVILFKFGRMDMLQLKCHDNNQHDTTNIVVVDEILDNVEYGEMKRKYVQAGSIACNLILKEENNTETIVDTGIFRIQPNTVHYIYAIHSHYSQQYYSLKMETSLASLSTEFTPSVSWSRWQIATTFVSCILFIVIIGTICLYKHHRSGKQYPACCRTRTHQPHHNINDNDNHQHNNHYHRIAIEEHNNPLRSY